VKKKWYKKIWIFFQYFKLTNILSMSPTYFTNYSMHNSLNIHFSLRSTTTKNSNWTFVCFIFLNKKKKLKHWTTILDQLNYISTCHSNNFHTNVVPSNLTFSLLKPTIKPSPFWNFHFVHPWQHHFVFFPFAQEW
jgi:hypothetical protein